MADRPTQSESWYRVAQLKPRLRSPVQTFRQFYRDKLWHVLTDPANNEYFRVDENAYYFLGLLDGRRTVAQAWALACSRIWVTPHRLKARRFNCSVALYVCNLIQADMSPDVRGMFDRVKKRKRQKIGGQMLNLLFLRLPLYDPDRLLDRWVKLFGWVFSKIGFALWLGLLMCAGYELTEHHAALGRESGNVLSPGNLIWLSISFWLLKLIHEFGHAFACKRFGRVNGSGGEVHTMGVMLVALMPVPYVDASSSWAFRNKWHRAAVGAAGMYIELAAAAVAAIVWSRTGSATAVHQIAYNVMFLAGVSTLLFNGNPLMRYDAYYMLCDIMEIPNLAQRSKDYLYYQIKRRVFGMKQLQDPSHGDVERHWFIPYAIAATIYRTVVSITIIMFVASQLFIIGLLMAMIGVLTMLLLPLLKFVRYIATNTEISRVRGRAVGATLVVAAVLIGGLGFIPVADGGRAEGVIEPRDLAMIAMAADGFVDDVLPSGQHVRPDGKPLLIGRNPRLVVQRQTLLAQRDIAIFRQREALGSDADTVADMNDQIEVLDEAIEQIEARLAELHVRAPLEGTWVAPGIEQSRDTYLERGEIVGMVATLDDLIIRVSADQNLGPRIEPEIGVGGEVEIRVSGRPDIQFTGRIERILPAGQQRLPSKALGVFAGGSLQTDANDHEGTKTTESFFEVHVDPDIDAMEVKRLFTGQRMVVRFVMPPRPLAVQGWRALRQLLQRRFQI